jgi:hypothetical protein
LSASKRAKTSVRRSRRSVRLEMSNRRCPAPCRARLTTPGRFPARSRMTTTHSCGSGPRPSRARVRSATATDTNLYGYALADPVNSVDPGGLASAPDRWPLILIHPVPSDGPLLLPHPVPDPRPGILPHPAPDPGPGILPHPIPDPGSLSLPATANCPPGPGDGTVSANPSPNWQPPTNPPQLPPDPNDVPPGWRVRVMPPTDQYPDGYWRLEKPQKQGGWQGIDPSTGKPGGQPQTHIPLPPEA